MVLRAMEVFIDVSAKSETRLLGGRARGRENAALAPLGARMGPDDEGLRTAGAFPRAPRSSSPADVAVKN